MIERREEKNMEMQGYKSTPTRFGRLTGNIFDSNPIYQFDIPPAMVDCYFPDPLRSFPLITCKSLVKRYLLYSKLPVTIVRSQLSDQMEYLSDSISFSDLLKELLTEKLSTKHYNFIVMDDCLILTRVPRHYHALSKHVFLSNRAEYIRYAGEICCDENGSFQLNNSSGTYRPSDRLIERAVQFFNHLAPELQFQGISCRMTTKLSIKQHIKQKIKRTLIINDDEECFPMASHVT